MYLVNEDDARTAYECVINSGGVNSSTRQIKWHAANVRCVKDDNNVGIYEGQNKFNRIAILKSISLQGKVLFQFNGTCNKGFTISIFTISGQKIIELSTAVNKGITPTLTWNGKTNSGTIAADGTYYYQLITGTEKISGQFVFVK